MGRTQRKRRRKKLVQFYTCNNENSSILLNTWLSDNGLRSSKKLVFAMFETTGRGLLTKKKISAGEELMNLPLNLTINVTSLLMDVLFCRIFLENKISCLLKYKQKVSFQSLMAFYLIHLRAQGVNSKWHVYLESLPKEYTVPYFLPNEMICHIDSEIVNEITKQKNIIVTSFNIFSEVLQNTTCNYIEVQNLGSYFTLSRYEWAYFTVNTRCVYMDLTKLIDSQNLSSTILSLINDNTKISLCPYLDMINHSPNARNETKLIINKDLGNLPLTKLNEDIFSDVRFSIYTKNNFDPYTQVFICYGDSHNLKLITEYGFFLPSNDIDFVPFTFDDINLYLNSRGVKLSGDQIAFINNHGLNKDLYIDLKGLSFNFYGLLMVVKYYYNKNLDISRLIYSAAICSNDRVLIEFIMPMVKDRLVSINVDLDKLCSFSKNMILDNCINLMGQYVNILEKFIKC
ncbi:SET domain-containing protein 4 [Bicyclus anynana]|uniref:SET domain-containing protein 4 n=1 Tax=Bicyclus anynana TaxID=110368 RepID=A0A6J1P9V7_BICAN|nr:SET domain-containing protein 4 [Bicyclus anynana]